MKKALVGLAVVLVVAVVGALVAPSFIDWTGYKANIEREISAVTGRTLSIGGRVEASLLPVPRFVATQLRLAGSEPGSDAVKVGRVELVLAWAPLLRGRIQITRIRLVDPELSLAALAPGLAADESPPGYVPTWRDVQLDNVAIENGRLILPAPAGDAPRTVEQINGRLSAETLTGPMRATGAAVAQGVPFTFDAALGDLASRRAVPTSLVMELRPGLAKLQYRGTLVRDAGQWMGQGRLQVDGAGFAAALAAAGIRMAPEMPLTGALGQPFSLVGTFTGDAASLAVNDAVIQLGAVRAEGAAALALSRRPVLDAALAVARLDLDQLLKITPAARPVAAARDAATLPTAPAAQPGWIQGVDVTLDLTVDALALGGGILRQVRVNAAATHNQIVVNQASAQLPGGSDIVLIGQVDAQSADADSARIDGAIEVNSDNLRGLLRWAGIDVAGVPLDRLRRFEGTARIEGTLARPAFSAIDMRLDSSRLTGALTFAPGDRLAISADLQLDRLNVDAYRPAETATASTAAAGPSAPSPLDLLNRLDSNLRLRVANLTWGAASADGFLADLTLSQGAIELRELAVRALAGASLRASGTLADLVTTPRAALDLEIRAAEADGLLRLAGLNVPSAMGALALSGRLEAGAGGAIALRGLDLRLGETHLAGDIALALAGDRHKWTAKLAGDTIALDLLLGQGGTSARQSAQALRAPSTTPGRSHGGWSRQPFELAGLAGLDAEIDLAARALLLAKLRVDDARLALRLQDGKADVTRLAGALYGGRLDGTIKLDLRQASPQLAATGTLAGVELRQVLGLIAGTDAVSGPADLRFDIAAAGDNPADLVVTLAGTLQVAGQGGTIDGYDLPAMSEKLKRIDRPTDLITLVQLGLGGGRTPFSALEGTFRLARGVARTDDLKLVAQAGELRTTGTVDLPQWSLDLVNEFRLTEHPKLPPLALKISGPIDAPRRIFDIEKLQSHLLRRGTDAPAR